MLTVHAAPLVLPIGAAPVADGAVAVEGDRITAIGPYEAIVAAHPAARVRRWPGVLAPGLRQLDAVRLLTACYHPDPREAAELGDQPLWGEEFERLPGGMERARWAGSVRRGLQHLLRYGTTHLAGPFTDPVVRTAVARSGLTEIPAPPAAALTPGTEPDLDPLTRAVSLADAVFGPLTVGGRADLAVFDVRNEAALYASGAGVCVATVLGGRLVHRRR